MMIYVQSGRFTRFIGSRRALRQGLTALLVVASGAAYGDTSSDYTVVDDVAIYFAVLPAEMLRGFPSGSEEARMHGGVPGGKHVHHLQIALFDARSNTRIDDARVAVTIAEFGLGSIKKELEPFQIGNTQTYGGYFEFRKSDLYEIGVQITLPETGREIEETIEYRHR